MSRRGWLLFAAMCVIWGLPYLLIKIAVDGVSVPVLIFLRTAMGAAVLLPLALRRGQLAGLARRWRPIAVFAAIEMIVPWLLLSDAERRITSSLAGLIIAAVPILGVGMARLTGDRDRLGAQRWIGLAVGFAGVVVLVGPHLGGGDPWSIVEVLLAAAGYAAAPLVVARRLADVPSLPMIAVSLTGTSIIYAPVAAFSWPTAMPSARVLIAIVGLAVVCTAVAFLAFFALIREVGPGRAMVFTYVNPAVSVSAGVLVLAEPLEPTIIAAFALIIAGSVLATIRRPARRTPDLALADGVAAEIRVGGTGDGR